MATLGQAHRFPTVIPLIAANAAPIVGVLFFGWDLLSIMFLYWMETAVVTFYGLLKVVKVGGLVVLGLLKIVADLHGHLRQRRGPATAPAPAGAPARAGTP